MKTTNELTWCIYSHLTPEEAEEIAMGEPVHQAEEYIEVEEGELL